MRIVLQRVTSASVRVDGEVIGKIGTGFLLLFGVGHEDTEEDCRRLADKISGLRIFSDENDKINLDLDSVGGEVLVVPQFTPYADCRKGNRPNFIQAAKPEKAKLLYVPAALFGTALAGRLIGLGLGDPASAANNQAMIIEGVSTLLILFAARRLGTS